MAAPLLTLPLWLTAALGTAGLGAGAITMVPQISKIVHDKSAKGTSWAMSGINAGGTSILLAFCGATVLVVGAGPLALGLGVTTLTLAGIRTISGITLLGMKYHYDYKYLNSTINSIEKKIQELKIDDTIKTNLQDEINAINTARTQSIGKRKLQNTQVSELKEESITKLLNIMNILNDQKDTDQNDKKTKKINAINKKILELLVAGKFYTKTPDKMKQIIDISCKINHILKSLSKNHNTTVDGKIENLKQIINKLDKLKKDKTQRLERNALFRGIKKFAKETLPFAFGKDVKKSNKEVAKEMSEISKIEDELKKMICEITPEEFNKLDDDEKKDLYEMSFTLFDKEIKDKIENGEILYVEKSQINALSNIIECDQKKTENETETHLPQTIILSEQEVKKLNDIIAQMQNPNPLLLIQQTHNEQVQEHH